MLNNAVAIRLATKEIWRNLGRFLLVSFVIALITLLVLFLAGLGEGLANANKEYLSKVDADLILFQEKADLSVAASQLGQSLMNDIRRVPGVAEAAPIGFTNVFVRFSMEQEPLAVSLLGVEPGKPGEMVAYEGRGLGSSRANEAILDRNVARQTGLQVGDSFTVESTQGTVDQFYDLEVVGISDGQQFFFAPSIAVPLNTWDRIRPRPTDSPSGSELVFNIVAVQLENPDELLPMVDLLEAQVNNIAAVDVVTAYESAPGYSEQQSTIQTQRGFTLLIGVLVVGGFFQIQTLQKVVQVGVLKALGASNRTVALATTFQIIVTNFFGVLLGGVATLLLVLTFPEGIPITFEGNQVQLALITLLLIGPLGGLMSIRLLTRVEPLTALGLSS
jgi:putative ABC transport system permease protein